MIIQHTPIDGKMRDQVKKHLLKITFYPLVLKKRKLTILLIMMEQAILIKNK